MLPCGRWASFLTNYNAMKMKTSLLLSILFSLMLGVMGDGYLEDPYLKHRPPFVRSLPVQIMLMGVVLTLVSVLLIHLMFTAQYHWPLAPVNYVLQLSGVTTLLISLIATIHVVLSSSLADSDNWPYMLNYISISVPPQDLDTLENLWSTAERATWFVMNASTSGLIQITHIQFLTLLYPSRLEGRLIFALLGPLAIIAAVMQLLPISDNVRVTELSTDVRNVCNATLSLIFTLALFFWGLFVNRKQAWRTDGGTAVFGCAALTLAVVSTALNFLYVHKADEYVWLPSLMWAVVLWQSFLGWWWWVGAGSGRTLSSDYEEKLKRDERNKIEARERRRDTKTKGRAQRMWNGVAGAFAPGQVSQDRRTSSSSQSRIRRPRMVRRRSDTDGEDVNDAASQLSRSSSATVMTQTGVTTTQSYSTFPPFLPATVRQYFSFLRRDHIAATRLQTEQRAQRIREMGRRDVPEGAPEPPPIIGWGWGWHGFGWRRRSPSVGELTDTPSEKRRKWARGDARERSGRRQTGVEYEMQRSSRWRGRREEPEGDADDIYASEEEGAASERPEERMTREENARPMPEMQNLKEPPTPLPAPAVANDTPNSIWWWGPLKRWRLQDSTTY